MQVTPQAVKDLIRALEEVPPTGGAAEPPALPPPGSGSNGGGMEPRIAKLEAHMEHVLADLRKLDGIPATLARVETRIDSLPDKDWVGTKMRNWVGGGVAFLTLVTIAAKFIHLG